MAVSWKLWLSVCLVVVVATGVAPQEDFTLEPANSTALRGAAVRFRAAVRRRWDVMVWKVGDVIVLTIGSDNQTNPSSDQFSARPCPDGGGDDANGAGGCVEFSIHNVTRQQAGPVSCALLGTAGEKTATLEVQESGSVLIAGGNRTAVQDRQVEFQCHAAAWFPAPSVTWTRDGVALDPGLSSTNSTPQGGLVGAVSVLRLRADRSATVRCLASVPALLTPLASSVFLEVVPDWTVLIAVVTSIGGFALLVLLILLLIFCRRRRKERKPNYTDEMMRARTQSQLGGVQRPGRGRGTVNEAYVQDGRSGEATPGDEADNRYYRGNGSRTEQMPDVVNSIQVGSVCETVAMKHRHQTIV